MRFGVVLGVSMFAACSSETGADIEIRSELPLTGVEVFIGAKHCGDECKHGIAWAAGQPAPAQRDDAEYETVYFSVIDRGQTIELNPVAEQDGGIWHLRLSAAADQNIEKIIIVGYDAQKNAAVAVIDEPIPIHSEVHWTVTLDPADRAQLAEMSAPLETEPQVRVATWGRDEADATASRCVVLQTWHYDHWKGTFIVPGSDPDCDNEEVECDPHYYNLNQGGTGVCANRPNADAPCRLGVPTCEDGKSAVDECFVSSQTTASTVCVPDAICDQCPDTTGLRQCVNETIRADLVSHVTCLFAGSASTGMACGAGYVGATSYFHLQIPCAAVEARVLSDVLVPSGSPLFSVNGGDANFSVKLEDLSGSVGCKVLVTFESGRAEPGDTSWAALAITPYYNTAATIIVPLEVEFVDYLVDCNPPQVFFEECDTTTLATDRLTLCGQ